MSLIEEIAERLRTECGNDFRIVGLAGDLAAIKERPTAMPAAYVYVIEEASEKNERLNGHLQRTEVDVGVMLITSNVADRQGGAAASDIEALKAHMRAALAGWQPASAEEPLDNVGGKLVKANAGAVWWEHVFGAAFYIGG